MDRMRIADCGLRNVKPKRLPRPRTGVHASKWGPSANHSVLRIPHFAFLVLFLFLGSCNPFAPALEEGDPFDDLFGNPTTIEGFFTNFRNAYELQDISVYESLLDSAFVFIYRDFDAQVDRQWGFAEDLEITRRLFQGANFIELKWNQVIAQDLTEEDRRARIIRSFNLTVGIEGADVFRGDGNVNFLLTRADTTAAWHLLRWRDESEL